MYANNQFLLITCILRIFHYFLFFISHFFLNLVCFVIFHFVPFHFVQKNVCYSKFLWFVIELFISPHYLHFPFSITYRSISIGYKFHATLHFLISQIFHSIPSATPTPTRGMSHNFTTLH